MFCSVAMSTYNGERFLAEQLSSICAQTRPVDEIVVSRHKGYAAHHRYAFYVISDIGL